jgi:hypothetical protein
MFTLHHGLHMGQVPIILIVHNKDLFTHVFWISKEILKIIISMCEILALILVDIQMLQHVHIMIRLKIVNAYVYEQFMII